MLAHKSVKVALFGLLTLALLAGVAAFAVGRANVAHADPNPQHAQDIVNTYLGILNGGMSGASGNKCDFSALSTVYADDATLTLTGGPFTSGFPPQFSNLGTPDPAYKGLQFQGITNVIGFYTTFCHDFGPAHPGWTPELTEPLTSNVVDSYEQLSIYAPNGNVVQTGYCEHVFTIKGDRIESLNWSVYA